MDACVKTTLGDGRGRTSITTEAQTAMDGCKANTAKYALAKSLGKSAGDVTLETVDKFVADGELLPHPPTHPLWHVVACKGFFRFDSPSSLTVRWWQVLVTPSLKRWTRAWTPPRPLQ